MKEMRLRGARTTAQVDADAIAFYQSMPVIPDTDMVEGSDVAERVEILHLLGWWHHQPLCVICAGEAILNDIPNFRSLVWPTQVEAPAATDTREEAHHVRAPRRRRAAAHA